MLGTALCHAIHSGEVVGCPQQCFVRLSVHLALPDLLRIRWSALRRYIPAIRLKLGVQFRCLRERPEPTFGFTPKPDVVVAVGRNTRGSFFDGKVEASKMLSVHRYTGFLAETTYSNSSFFELRFRITCTSMSMKPAESNIAE